MLNHVWALTQLLCHLLVFSIMLTRWLLQLQPLVSLYDNIQRQEGKGLLFSLFLIPFFKSKGKLLPKAPQQTSSYISLSRTESTPK